jgi:RNA recognition motif. (a.k.a. RRM, RBD, or RNP domain)
MQSLTLVQSLLLLLLLLLLQVNGVELRYDRAGNSIGQAVVTFNRLPDAKKAVQDFHGRTLDGTPMQVFIHVYLLYVHTSCTCSHGYTAFTAEALLLLVC